MTKFDNYIYYTICEASIPLFNKSAFSTYSSWCRTLHNSMKRYQMSQREINIIIAISDRVELIYSLGNEKTSAYVADYFALEKYLEFEKPVRLILETFKNSIN